MAHHVAELIDRSSTAAGKAKVEAERECRAAILELWAHRRQLRPRSLVEELEPLIETIDLLKPDEIPFHHRHVWRVLRDEEGGQEEASREWIELAIQADSAAGALVGWALGKAAASSVQQSLPWIELARAAGLPDDRLVELTIRLRDLDPTYKEIDPAKQAIENQIARMKELRRIVATADRTLRSDLTALKEAKRNAAIAPSE